MLAPPVQRAGVSRGSGASRTRSADITHSAGGGGGVGGVGGGRGSRSGGMQLSALGLEETQLHSAITVNSGQPQGPLFAQTQAKGSVNGSNAAVNGGGGGGGAAAGAAQSFHVYPLSLMFLDREEEIEYLSSAFSRRVVAKYIRRTALALLSLFAVSLAFDAANAVDASNHPSPAAPDASSVFLLRAILTGVCVLLTFLFGLVSFVKFPLRPPFQLSMTLLLTLMAGVWAAASVLRNGDVLMHTQSASYLLWLLIVHGSQGRFLFLHYSYIPSAVGTVVFIVTSVIWASSFEDKKALAWHCLLSLCGTASVWLVQHRLEYLNRLAFHEKRELKTEAFTLRKQMFNMTLEHYDIADRDEAKELELKSPMEHAMAKLQSLSQNNALPKEAFVDVQEIIGLLGASDLFKVSVGKALEQNKNIRLDEETMRYLFDLGGDGGGGGQFEEGGALTARTRAPTLYGEDAAAAAAAASAGAGGGAGGNGGGGSIGGEESNGGGSDPVSRFSLPGQTSVVSSIPSGVLAAEERAVNEILKKMDQYNFDVFEVANLSGVWAGRPLFFVGTALFKKYDLLKTFNIDRVKLSNFLNVIENGYGANPYHNGIHASDVATTVHYFLHSKMRPYTTDVEILALVIASLIHDFDHPGRTNQFHIATKDHKALLYNDRSVLENHHCAQAFFQLNKEENNIFADLPQQQYVQVRKLIVELVLATDLGAHFDFLAQFKSLVSSGALDGRDPAKLEGQSAAANRLLVHKMALKCGDLGHSSKTLALHEKWTKRITEEFYRQGDEEKKRKLPISPFMDRSKANLPQSQVGFLEFLVIPMFTIWTKFLNLDDDTCPLMKQLTSNKAHWDAQIKKSEQPPAAAPAQTATAAPAQQPPTTARLPPQRPSLAASAPATAAANGSAPAGGGATTPTAVSPSQPTNSALALSSAAESAVDDAVLTPLPVAGKTAALAAEEGDRKQQAAQA